ALEEMNGRAERRERIAQLMRQHGEELVLPAICVRQLRSPLLELVAETLAVSDVGPDADQPSGAAGGVAQHPSRRGHTAYAAVRPDGAELDVVTRPVLP